MTAYDQCNRVTELARKFYGANQTANSNQDWRTEVDFDNETVHGAAIVQIDTLRDYRYCELIRLSGPRALDALEAMLLVLAGERAWSVTAPKVEGWYWLRDPKGEKRAVELIWSHHEEVMVAYGYPVSRYVDHQWAGPLVAPKVSP